MDIIRAEHITKIYNGRRAAQAVTALNDFSLSVREGEIFGLLGPNGAGKTTFIKVLLEIAFPTSGRAHVLGAPAGDTAVKSRLGYLPENHRYPAYLSGEQVLRYFGRLSGVEPARLEAQVASVLRLVGMEQWRKVRIRKYSKGMMQRIGLAQALLGDPKLVILDEPTDGVDPIGRKQIREMLQRLRDEGRTIFLNSHLLSEVEMICDRVAILNKGRLVREGGVKELTEHEHVFIVTLDTPMPEALRMQWEATRAAVTANADGSLVITAADTAELNRRIDELRGAGVLIDSITHKRQSLEDLFIDIIGRENA